MKTEESPPRQKRPLFYPLYQICLLTEIPQLKAGDVLIFQILLYTSFMGITPHTLEGRVICKLLRVRVVVAGGHTKCKPVQMKALIYKPLLFVTYYYCYTEKSQKVLTVPDNINLYRYVSHFVTISHMSDYKKIYIFATRTVQLLTSHTIYRAFFKYGD